MLADLPFFFSPATTQIQKNKRWGGGKEGVEERGKGASAIVV